MPTNRLIRNKEDLTRLVQTLARCRDVVRFDDGTDTAASAIAYCFDSLEGYFREFLEHHLPQLLSGKLSDQQVCDNLYEIGTSFGQILWHIRLPKFYQYLSEEKGEAPQKPGG